MEEHSFIDFLSIELLPCDQQYFSIYLRPNSKYMGLYFLENDHS